MIPKLSKDLALVMLRQGSVMMLQRGEKNQYFIEPGGEIGVKTFQALRLIPNVVADHDGLFDEAQSWRWTR